MVRTLKPEDFSKTDFERNKALITEVLGLERITDLSRCVFSISVPEKPEEEHRNDQLHHMAVYVPSAPGKWASAAFLAYLCKLEVLKGFRDGQQGNVVMRGEPAALAAAYFAPFEGDAPGTHPTIDALRKPGALVSTLVVPDSSRENRIRNFYGEWPNLGKDARHLAMLESAEMLTLLEFGAEHPIESGADGQWTVRPHVQEGILLYFRSHANQLMKDHGGIAYDKIPLLWTRWLESEFALRGFRPVPGSIVRSGAHIATGVVLMPSLVNIGASVGKGTMVDTWATVGSCAQIGAECHLSGGVGIGGVLEPPGARPVVVEDGCFLGSRVIVVEGFHVEREAVIGAGVVLTASTPVIDVTGPEPVEFRGRVPARSVVIPGMRPKKFPGGEFLTPCALIIGKRTESTDKKVSLNAALRDFNVPV